MLTPLIPCINILFSTQFKSFILSKFYANNTWTFLVQPSKPGLFFNSPKNSAWAVRGQPPPQPRFHFFGTEIHGHFRPNNTQNHNLHTNNAYGPIIVRKSVSGLPKTVPNFSISVPSFGTDQTATHGFTPPKPLTRLLNQKINRVGEDPYLSELSKLHKIGTHA